MRSQSCLTGVRKEEHESAARARTRVKQMEAERAHQVKLSVSRRGRAEFDVGQLWERLVPRVAPMPTIMPGNEVQMIVRPLEPPQRKSGSGQRTRDAKLVQEVQYASTNYDLAPVRLPPAISSLEQLGRTVGSWSNRAREWSGRQFGRRSEEHDPSLHA